MMEHCGDLLVSMLENYILSSNPTEAYNLNSVKIAWERTTIIEKVAKKIPLKIYELKSIIIFSSLNCRLNCKVKCSFK